MDVANRGADRRSQAGDHVDIGAQDARQGMRTGYMRRVLTISVFLAVAAMLGVWLWSYRPAPHASVNPPQASSVSRDQTPASTPPSKAAPQSAQPLP